MRRSSSRRSVEYLAEPVCRHLVGHLLDRHADALTGDGIDVPRHFRVAALHADDVDDAVDLGKHLLDRLRELGELVRIVAEDLDLDRRRRSLEIAKHVLQQLHEFDFGQRCGFLQLRPHVRNDFLRRSAALTARLQADEDVARVLRRGKQAQLGAGAPRVRRDFGRIGDHLLHGADDPIRIFQCGRRPA